MKIKQFLHFFLLIFFAIVAGCTRTLQPDPGTQGALAFVPPTLSAPTESPIPTINATLLAKPSPTIVCQDNLLFIKDLSIPDGTIIRPGASIDKQWEVQNNGTCNWGSGYTIRLIGGSDLGAETTQDLFPARADTLLTIQIVFVAPDEPGNYRSAWQAYNPDGVPFGDPFYIDIVVSEE